HCAASCNTSRLLPAGGMWSSSTSRVVAMAYSPSLKASSRPVDIAWPRSGGLFRTFGEGGGAGCGTADPSVLSQRVGLPRLPGRGGAGTARSQRRGKPVEAARHDDQRLGHVATLAGDAGAERLRVAQTLFEHQPRCLLVGQHIVALIEQLEARTGRAVG